MSVTFPVFVTANVYVIPCPTALYVFGLALFTTASAGAATNVWVSSSVSLTFDPTGGVPVAVATFVNVPASMSACVRV